MNQIQSFVGVDIVHIPSFAEQLALPGSTFERVFSITELRVAASKADRAQHLAGRWAAKEAFIKAWSQSIYGRPPLIAPDLVNFQEVEVRPDRWGRVGYAVHGEIAQHTATAATSLSISHDGEYAIATCLFSPAPAD